MTALPNGVYNIYNVGTKLYMDLQGNGATDGTPFIGFPLNTPATGNQQVRYAMRCQASVFTDISSAVHFDYASRHQRLHPASYTPAFVGPCQERFIRSGTCFFISSLNFSVAQLVCIRIMVWSEALAAQPFRLKPLGEATTSMCLSNL